MKKKILLILALLVGVTCIAMLSAFFVPTRFFPGYMGDLKIESTGINVPVVNMGDPSSNSGKILQFLVDRPSCAVAYKLSLPVLPDDAEDYSTTIICDHSRQGFSRIANCKLGDIAQIVQLDGTVIEYEVTANFTGHNTGNEITDENGDDIVKDNLGGVTLYTCLDSWQNIRIVFLQPKLT